MAKQKKAAGGSGNASGNNTSTGQNPANAAPQGFLDGKVLPLMERVPTWVRTIVCLLLIAIAASCAYVVNKGEPPYPFWDENYHMTSGQRYIEGIGHFEPHPPLALLLIAAGEKLSGANADIDKHQLVIDKYIDGNKMPAGFSYNGMRLMPSLFAAFGALLFFGLLYTLTGNRFIALLFSTLYVFENAYVVHFRAVHLDSIQMFFCLATIWQFVRLWKRPDTLSWKAYAWLGVLAGLAIMAKINAALLLIIFPILYFKDVATHFNFEFARLAQDFIAKAGSAIVAILVVVLTIFAIHGAIGRKLPDPESSAGKQDIENMSPTYKEYLTQHGTLTPGVVMSITRDYFKFMDKDHLGVPKLDICKPGENGSHPLHWLIMDKTINYRWDSADGKTRYVQLVGNQVSWYLGLVSLFLSVALIVNHRFFKNAIGNRQTYHLIEVFTALYATFMVLHLYLGTQRVMYLYHYFLGLLITYVLVVLQYQYLTDLHALRTRTRLLIASGMAIAISLSFAFFAPLSNHTPLSKTQCEARNIFSHIVDCQ
ncbi:phospholipid carrier-dependent glycosyltransferase [Uliginosibacterium sp. H3]|uniref:Polyprenol-phosphate-mannose--protein mannosyltransferase n=1 Tax=Uliginosibacterium silvisoli TaxID=3114758 RepID=A0ABU6K7K6_9RHOO|nr:phospholipid carrier-dependent glycosyltransferase [Uliginosibacterium sp. H3]